MASPLHYDDLPEWLAGASASMGVPSACFHLLSSDGRRILCQAVSQSMRATHLAYGLELEGCPAVFEALESGRALAIDDAARDLRVAQVARDRYRLASVLYQPVRIGSGRRGVLILADRVRRAWQTEDLQLAAGLARRLEGYAEGADETTVVPSAEVARDMLGTVPGQVLLVDENLMAVATSSAVDPTADLGGQCAAVSVAELISDSDRGVEFRRALIDVLAGERRAFDGLVRTVHGSWWVSIQRVPGQSPPLAGVHVRRGVDLPAAVREQEEQQRLVSIGRLASMVSHEINNALQIITASVHELREGDRELGLRSIETATERAARVTGDLLAFGRRSPLRQERLSLESWVRSLAVELRPLVEPRCRLEFTCYADCDVSIDADRMAMALANLCKNARDASPERSTVTVEVDVEGAAGEEQHGVIRVRDQGVGFAPELLPDLGQPFLTTKAPGFGAGLGLSVVKETVCGLNGSLEFGNADGGGAEVTVRLPVVRSEEPVARPAEPVALPVEPVVAAEAPRPRKTPEEGSARILVVEDEQSLARMLDQMLTRAGFVADCVGTCSDARMKLQDADGYDVVLLDVTLPDGSGIDVLTEHQGRDGGPGFVVMSGYLEEERLLEAMHRGTRYLGKPFNSGRLVEEIERALPAR